MQYVLLHWATPLCIFKWCLGVRAAVVSKPLCSNTTNTHIFLTCCSGGIPLKYQFKMTRSFINVFESRLMGLKKIFEFQRWRGVAQYFLSIRCITRHLFLYMENSCRPNTYPFSAHWLIICRHDHHAEIHQRNSNPARLIPRAAFLQFSFFQHEVIGSLKAKLSK